MHRLLWGKAAGAWSCPLTCT